MKRNINSWTPLIVFAVLIRTWPVTVKKKKLPTWNHKTLNRCYSWWLWTEPCCENWPRPRKKGFERPRCHQMPSTTFPWILSANLQTPFHECETVTSWHDGTPAAHSQAPSCLIGMRWSLAASHLTHSTHPDEPHASLCSESSALWCHLRHWSHFACLRNSGISNLLHLSQSYARIHTVTLHIANRTILISICKLYYVTSFTPKWVSGFVYFDLIAIHASTVYHHSVMTTIYVQLSNSLRGNNGSEISSRVKLTINNQIDWTPVQFWRVRHVENKVNHCNIKSLSL